MKRRLAHVGRLAGRTLVNFHHDHGLGLSASVAFYSLLSLGPMIYLVSLTASRLFDSPNAISEAIAGMSAFLPEQVAQELERFALNLRVGGGLVTLAVPGLLWIASSALLALEYAINVAFGTVARRSILRSRLKALLLLLLGTAFLLVSVFVPTALAGLRVVESLLDVPLATHVLLDRGSYPLVLGVTFTIFVFFFKLLPRGRVGYRPAMTGAAMSLILWELARKFYGTLLARSFAYGLLSGALAGIVGFLLWIDTAVITLLLGAELAALLNGNRPLPVASSRKLGAA